MLTDQRRHGIFTKLATAGAPPRRIAVLCKIAAPGVPGTPPARGVPALGAVTQTPTTAPALPSTAGPGAKAFYNSTPASWTQVSKPPVSTGIGGTAPKPAGIPSGTAPVASPAQALELPAAAMPTTAPKPPEPAYAMSTAQRQAMAANPIMNPAAQNYYADAMANNSINIRKAKELEYQKVPGGLTEVMRVANKFGGGTATPASLDRNIPITGHARAGSSGTLWHTPAGPTLLNINPDMAAQRAPAAQIDTVAHETTHAADSLRGRLDATKHDKHSIPVAHTNAAYFSQKSEQEAGPFHYMKAYMANKDGNIPKTELEAKSVMDRFRKIHVPNDATKDYPKEQWDAIFASPAAPKTFLQTVRAPIAQQGAAKIASLRRG